MIAGVLKETGNENRVALLPAEAGVLKSMGIEVLVESGAGERAFATDSVYESAGAKISDRKTLIAQSDL